MSKHFCLGGLGLPGSGKSLDQVENYILPALISGQDVYSTTWINWKHDNFHYVRPDSPKDVMKVKNATIFFDEIGQTFPPRAWKGENSELWQFFQFHRKRHNDIIFNTQHVSLVAKSAEIIVSQWDFYTPVENDILHPAGKYIPIHLEEGLSYSQILKIASGWELGIYDIEEIEEKTRAFFYKVENLRHIELDGDKLELFQWYCKKCEASQESKIKLPQLEEVEGLEIDKKTGFFLPENRPICPKHPAELMVIRDSPMYDTDYDPFF